MAELSNRKSGISDMIEELIEIRAGLTELSVDFDICKKQIAKWNETEEALSIRERHMLSILNDLLEHSIKAGITSKE